MDQDDDRVMYILIQSSTNIGQDDDRVFYILIQSSTNINQDDDRVHGLFGLWSLRTQVSNSESRN